MNEFEQLSSYKGANFAPVKPLLALKEKSGDRSPYSKHYLTDALKEKYKDFLRRDENARKEMISVGQLTALFIEGKQILDWNPFTNCYTPRSPRRSDPNKIKAVNFMQYYCSNWQSKWRSSNPDIVVRAMSNRDQEIARARKANAVVDHLEYKMYNRWYNLHEGLMSQVFGWYGNQVTADYKNGVSFLRQVFETKQVQIGRGFGKCWDCEFTGEAGAFGTGDSEPQRRGDGEVGSLDAASGVEDKSALAPSGGADKSVRVPGVGDAASGVEDRSVLAPSVLAPAMPVCPACGSRAVYHEPPPMALVEQEAGFKKITQPNIKAVQLAFPACAWDYRHRMEESAWAIIEEDVSWGAIKSVIGNVVLPEGESPNDFGLEVIAALAATGSAIGGRSDVPKPDRKRSGVISRMYLSAEDLYDIKIQGEQNLGEQTVSGKALPFGSRMSDLFPEGCCVMGVNGMSTILSITADHHSRTVTSGVYHMKPLSGTGRGVADAVEVQKRFNRFDSQAVRYMGTMSTPATLVAEGAIEQNQRHLLGEPGADIPIRLQNFPEVRSVSDLIFPLQGQSVPGDMLQYTYQHLSNFMQLAYHITDFSGGLQPRIRNETATGAEILDSNANELFSPSLDIKADVRLDTAMKAFALWCELNPHRRFISAAPTSKTGSRGIEVCGDDVSGEYEWSVAPGSEQPKNRLTKRKDAMAFYGLFGGVLGYIQAKQVAPQEVAEAERTWDMDFAGEIINETAEICRRRLEYARALIAQAAQFRSQASAHFGAELPPVDFGAVIAQVKPSMLVGEADHLANVRWFAELLKTDEGQEMSDEERLLVQAFIEAEAGLAKAQAAAVAQAQSEVAGAASVGAGGQTAETQRRGGA